MKKVVERRRDYIPVLGREPRVESVVAAGRGVHIRGVLPILAKILQIWIFFVLIPLLQFHKILGVPVRKSQIRKFSLLICKLKIGKFLQNTAQVCHKTVLILFLKWFSYFVQFELEHYMLYLLREKTCIAGLRKCWVREKNLGSAKESTN